MEREKKRRRERVRSVATDPDNQDNSKEPVREAQGIQGLSKNRSCGESVFPLSRLTRSFRNKYH